MFVTWLRLLDDFRQAACWKGLLGLQHTPGLLGQTLFEPMVRIGFGVEGFDLDVSRSPVQRNGLTQRAVCLESNHGDSCFTGVLFQLEEQPAPQSEAPCSRGDPHSFQFRGRVSMELECTATDGLAAQAGDDAFGDCSIEAPNLLNSERVHNL